MSISQQLHNAIETSGETYYRIAKDAGVDWKTVASFMDGTRPDVRVSTVDRLCEYFGLTLCQQKKQRSRKKPVTASKQRRKK